MSQSFRLKYRTESTPFVFVKTPLSSILSPTWQQSCARSNAVRGCVKGKNASEHLIGHWNVFTKKTRFYWLIGFASEISANDWSGTIWSFAPRALIGFSSSEARAWHQLFKYIYISCIRGLFSSFNLVLPLAFYWLSYWNVFINWYYWYLHCASEMSSGLSVIVSEWMQNSNTGRYEHRVRLKTYLDRWFSK